MKISYFIVLFAIADRSIRFIS